MSGGSYNYLFQQFNFYYYVLSLHYHFFFYMRPLRQFMREWEWFISHDFGPEPALQTAERIDRLYAVKGFSVGNLELPIVTGLDDLDADDYINVLGSENVLPLVELREQIPDFDYGVVARHEDGLESAIDMICSLEKFPDPRLQTVTKILQLYVAAFLSISWYLAENKIPIKLAERITPWEFITDEKDPRKSHMPTVLVSDSSFELFLFDRNLILPRFWINPVEVKYPILPEGGY